MAVTTKWPIVGVALRAAMAGDVNLFFNDQDDRTVAEIEVLPADDL